MLSNFIYHHLFYQNINHDVASSLEAMGILGATTLQKQIVLSGVSLHKKTFPGGSGKLGGSVVKVGLCQGMADAAEIPFIYSCAKGMALCFPRSSSLTSLNVLSTSSLIDNK